MQPAPIIVPTFAPSATPAQSAFREAVQAVDALRQQLHELRSAQAEARRRYWQQVGRVAADVVAARHGLYHPLESALLLNYFSQLEEEKITALIIANAHDLEQRFGEDESAVLKKYGAAPAEPAPKESEAPPTPAAAPRRPTKAERQAAAAEAAAQTALATNAKTVYRQLARVHHPDLQRDATAQAEKTVLMQRIIAAYEADDLLALLQLLAELPAADPASDDLLTRYTAALAQQRRTLQLEVQALRYGPDHQPPLSPKRQEIELRQLKRALRDEAAYLQQLTRRLEDPTELRQMLREGLMVSG